MGKYSDDVLADLVKHLDALDVLELIDFHPESIQLEGETASCFCPLSQDTSGRHMTIDLATKTFRSSPPTMPEQRGNIVDLYARCRRIPFDLAVEELADEFNILLATDKSADQLDKVMAEAATILDEADKNPAQREKLLPEVEKRLRRLLEVHPDDPNTIFGEFRLRVLQGNMLMASTTGFRLLSLHRAKKAVPPMQEIGRLHLAAFPNDLAFREKLGEELAAAGAAEPAAHEFMALADLAEQQGKPRIALAAYRRVRDLHIGALDVYPMIIALLTARAKSDEIVIELQRYVDYLRHENRFREARERVLEKLALAPGDFDARLQVVDLSAQIGLDDEWTGRCLDLIDELREAGALSEAVEALSTLSSEQPENAQVVEALATVYRRMGEEEMAGEMQLRLVELYRKDGETGSALLILEELLSKDADNPRAVRLMAEVLVDGGDERAAADVYARLLKLQRSAGELDDALATTQRMLKADPERMDAREAEIELLFQLSRNDEALLLLDKHARYCIGANLNGELAALLERALALVDLVPIRVMLSSTYQRMGQKDKATRILSNLRDAMSGGEGAKTEVAVAAMLEADPSNPKLMELMADLHRGSGRINEARIMYLRLAAHHVGRKDAVEAGAALDRLMKTEPGDAALLREAEKLARGLSDEERLVAIMQRQMDVAADGAEHGPAEAIAGRLLEIRPENRKAHRVRIKALDALGRAAEALAGREVLARLLSKLPSHLEEEASVLRELIKAQPKRQEHLERLAEILAARGGEQELALRVDQLLDLQKGDRERSIRFLRELLKRRTSTALHLRLARLYREAGRTEEMIAEMQALIEAAETAGRNDDAIALYREALEQVPDSVSTRAGLILLLRKLDRTDEAVEHYFELARGLMAAKKFRDALGAWEEVGELSPENPEVFRGHASVLREMGMEAEANARIRDLAGLLGRQGKIERAIAVLQEVLEDSPNSIETRREVIRLRREAGQNDLAVAEMNKLAALQAAEGDAEGALATRREAVSTQPQSSETRLALIKALETAGKTSEAAEESLALASALTAEGLHVKAVDILDRLIKTTPSNLPARRLRARVYDNAGDEKRALAEYRDLQAYIDTYGVGAGSGPSSVPQSGRFDPSAEGDDSYPELQVMSEYVFDTFIVGSRNNFAFATSKAVAEHPGSARNPLFLYSDVGLGKTHLLHAIANAVKAKKPDARILYTSTEYFTSELIDAIQNNKVAQFRNKHLQADILLLDDVQFLAGKERSQEEFFHLFNMLFQKQRQIVVTSDRPPKDIAHLNTRLRSRFGQGVIVDIQPPDVETRMAILRAEAERRGVPVPGDAITVLAERISTNIRELKGAFNQLLTQYEIAGQPVSAASALAIVDKYFS